MNDTLCDLCGNKIKLLADEKSRCDNCGYPYIERKSEVELLIKEAISENVNGNFDVALELFEKILNGSKNIEAYIGVIFSKNGVNLSKAEQLSPAETEKIRGEKLYDELLESLKQTNDDRFDKFLMNLTDKNATDKAEKKIEERNEESDSQDDTLLEESECVSDDKITIEKTTAEKQPQKPIFAKFNTIETSKKFKEAVNTSIKAKVELKNFNKMANSQSNEDKELAQKIYSALDSEKFDEAKTDIALLKDKSNKDFKIISLLYENKASSFTSLFDEEIKENAFEVIENICENSTKEEGELFVAELFNITKKCFSVGQLSNALKLFEVIYRFNSPIRAQIAQTALMTIKMLLVKNEVETAKKLFDCYFDLTIVDNWSKFIEGVDNIVKLFLEKQQFEYVSKYIEFVLSYDKSDYKALLMQFLAKNKVESSIKLSENLELSNYDDITGIIEKASPKNAAIFLNLIYSIIFRAFSKTNAVNEKSDKMELAIKIFELVYKYEFESRLSNVEKLLSKIFICNVYVEGIDKLFNLCLTAIGESLTESDYYEYLTLFAEMLRVDKKFELANSYYQKVLSFDFYNKNARFGEFLAKNQVSADKELEKVFNSELESQLIEIFKFVSQKERAEILSKLFAVSIALVNNSEKVKLASKYFEVLLRFLGNDLNGKRYEIYELYLMAQTCARVKEFDLAKRYYYSILKINETEYKAYWAILKCKLKCVDDVELIKQNKPLTEMSEYKKAIEMCAFDEQAIKHYVEIGSKQKQRIKEEVVAAIERKRKAKRMFVTMIGSIAAAVLIFVAIISGIIIKKESNIIYSKVDGGYGIRAGSLYNKENIIIDEMYKGEKVVEISSNAFRNKDQIQSIKIPLSVSSIKEEAFAGCKNLSQFYVGETNMSKNVFQEMAVNSVNQIVESTINLKEIEKGAFRDCGALKCFIIPKSTTQIGEECFFNSGVKELIIVGSPEEIGANFVNKDSISEIILVTSLNSVERLKSRMSVDESKITEKYEIVLQFAQGEEEKAMVTLNKAFELTLPTKNGYKFVGWALPNNSVITDSNGKSIGKWSKTFESKLSPKWEARENSISFDSNGGQGHMDGLVIKTDESKKLPYNRFTRLGADFMGWATSANGAATYANGAMFKMSPDAPTVLYAVWRDKFILSGNTLIGVTEYGKTLSSLTIPSSITSIKFGALNGCSSLCSLILPFVGNSAQESSSSSHLGYIFGNNSYKNSYHIEQMGSTYYIPSSLIHVSVNGDIIPRGAFMNCAGLMSIELSSTTSQIGDSAFSNCYTLSSINIPKSASLGSDILSGCYSVKKLTVSNGNTLKKLFGNSSYTNSYSWGSCYIPNSLDALTITGNVKADDFAGLRISQVSFASGVTEIGSSAFENCSRLTNVNLSNITKIGASAFDYCQNLKDVIIPKSVERIGNQAFENIEIRCEIDKKPDNWDYNWKSYPDEKVTWGYSE